MVGLVTIIGIAYALLAWFRPRAAFGVLLALLPSYLVRFTVFGVPMTVLEGMILILALVVFVRLLFGHCESAKQSRASRCGKVGIAEFIPFDSQTRSGQALSLRRTRVGLAMMAFQNRLACAPRTRNDRGKRILCDPWILLPLLWIAAGTIAAIGSPAGVRAWGIWKAYIVEPVIVFWMMRYFLARGANVMRIIMMPLALSALGVSLIAIAQYFTGFGIPYPWSQPGQFRATSVFGYPNAVGLFLAPIVPFLFVSLLQSGWRIRILFVTAAIVSFIAILLAKSVGAVIALIVGIGTLAVLMIARDWFARHARGIAPVIVGGWVLVSLFITAWLPYQPERPRTGPQWIQAITFQRWSGSVRLSQYRETWALLHEHPVRGAGLAGYQTAIAPFHEKANVEIFLYPHNLLLAVWVELGLFGVFIFLAILYRCLSLGLVTSGLPLAAVVSLLAMLAYGFVDVPYFKNDLSVLWWITMALSMGCLSVSSGTVAVEENPMIVGPFSCPRTPNHVPSQ